MDSRTNMFLIARKNFKDLGVFFSKNAFSN